jgi:hypothetical protein
MPIAEIAPYQPRICSIIIAPVFASAEWALRNPSSRSLAARVEQWLKPACKSVEGRDRRGEGRGNLMLTMASAQQVAQTA